VPPRPRCRLHGIRAAALACPLHRACASFVEPTRS
jgi:hypothetical protein